MNIKRSKSLFLIDKKHLKNETKMYTVLLSISDVLFNINNMN